MEGEVEGRVIRLREVPSTNDAVFDLKDRYPLPIFLRADVQTDGRGRYGRRWVSDRGGLWMSALFKKTDLTDGYKFMIGSALVVKDVVEPLLEGVKCDLHFPNDVYVNGKKLAGVLVEEREDFLITGVGLNVNQPVPPHPSATTLRILTGRTYDLGSLAEGIADGLSSLTQRGFTEVFEEWRAKLSTIGKRVVLMTVDGELEGTFADIGGDFTVVLKTSESELLLPAHRVIRLLVKE